MNDFTEYVLGFVFNKNKSSVILLRKTKPNWQAGKLNGVGGKIEKGETSCEAMIRETQEEIGIVTDKNDWTLYCTMKGYGWMVHVFKAILENERFDLVEAKTEEEPFVLNVHDISEFECISNVEWLVHMALDDNYGKPFKSEIIYNL
jgi:8-oxo-dGTP diphosphatase